MTANVATIKVKVQSTGILQPTNPVVIGPTVFSNLSYDVNDLREYADNAAARAYANSVADDEVHDSVIDGGTY